MIDYFFEVSEPEWEVALPPPLEPPFIQPRFTITMELLDVLLCPCYDASSGWRFKLRHGAAYFLKKIGYPNTELCLYSEASPGDVQIPLQRFFHTKVSNIQRGTRNIGHKNPEKLENYPNRHKLPVPTRFLKIR